MAKRKPAKDLVAGAATKKRHNWFSTLPKGDQHYIRQIVAAMRDTPGARIYVVAGKLDEEFGYPVSKETIVRTLKELLNEKA